VSQATGEVLFADQWSHDARVVIRRETAVLNCPSIGLPVARSCTTGRGACRQRAECVTRCWHVIGTMRRVRNAP
jgi:hypothetical protein